MTPETAFDAAIFLARQFAEDNVPYAIGGALAYGQYAVPRATNDVDINVFLNHDALAPAFAALKALGIAVDEAASRNFAATEGAFIVYFGGFRVDVFTPSVEFSWEAARTRVPAQLGSDIIWFLSPEALCVFKLLFYRSKDFADLERLVAIMGTQLDVAYVREHIAKMMGEDDDRVKTWDEITTAILDSAAPQP